MTVYISDYGKRYIVSEENLDEAARWLADEWYKYKSEEWCKQAIMDNCDLVFDGDVPYGYSNYAFQFIERFCEPGTYACFLNEEEFEFGIIWKDEEGMHEDGKRIENPFFEKMNELDRRFK